MRLRRILKIGGLVFVGLVVIVFAIGGIAFLREKELYDLEDEVANLTGQGKFAEAMAVADRHKAMAQQRYGEQSLQYANSLRSVGLVYYQQKRYASAIPLLQQALLIVDKVIGPESASSRILLLNLGWAHLALERYAEAEPLFQKALVSAEKVAEPDNEEIIKLLHGLASLYDWQGRLPTALALYGRALKTAESLANPDALQIATLLVTMARMSRDMAKGEEDRADARNNLERAVEVLEAAKLGDSIEMARALSGLAGLRHLDGDDDEAEQLFQRALSISERKAGSAHATVASVLLEFGAMYRDQEHYQEAEVLYERARQIIEQFNGPDDVSVAYALKLQATLSMRKLEWQSAVTRWRQGVGITMRRAINGLGDDNRVLPGNDLREVERGEIERDYNNFVGLIKAAHRLAEASPGLATDLAREMFELAQWAIKSEAARSLVKMAARGSKVDRTLDELVRERDALLEDLKGRTMRFSLDLAYENISREENDEGLSTRQLATAAARIEEINRRLLAEFPEYVALTRPAVLDVGEVQSRLREDEALVLFLETDDEFKPVVPEETFIWVVTKHETRWTRSALGKVALKRQVTTLRCGLDAALWDEDLPGDDIGKSYSCADLVGEEPQRDAEQNISWETLPFRHDLAYELFTELFGGLQGTIAGKHLLVVPSGALEKLPFHVLQTAAFSQERPAWLAHKHAISILPAVSSLRALRHTVGASGATRPMLGIGNPLLDGDPKERHLDAALAKLARDKKCDGLVQVAENSHTFRRVRRAVTASADLADIEHIRSQPPLPETADELCAVARQLGTSANDVLLGVEATETLIKKLSKEGKLADYRVVHFATHGAVVGEIDGLNEPGLILTPPQTSSAEDDGYLSASEIATLRLDADWVILSACNTAAGGSYENEALSGLARAFLYAGARALLVSHWKVDSWATVELVTSAVSAITRDPTIGRAEALRQAMLQLIDRTGRQHHPAFWAPFVLVGEGAVR